MDRWVKKGVLNKMRVHVLYKTPAFIGTSKEDTEGVHDNYTVFCFLNTATGNM
jgi:hypothetical protein